MPAKPLKDARNEPDSRKALEYAWERFRVNILVKSDATTEAQHVARAIFYSGAMAFYSTMMDNPTAKTMTDMEAELMKYKELHLNRDICYLLVLEDEEGEEAPEGRNVKKPN